MAGKHPPKKALLAGWFTPSNNERENAHDDVGDGGVIKMATVEPIDNSIGLNSGGVNESEIRVILERYAIENNNYGFTHVAMLSPGGNYIIAGPNVGDSMEKIEGVIGDRQFIVH